MPNSSEIQSECMELMEKAVEAFKKDLASKIRTGRASVSILDGVKIDYYGNPTPLNQVANLSTPDPKLVLVQPWENSMLKIIEKEILKADIGLTPMNDGKVIRIPIPDLTTERREEFVKLIGKMQEDAKVSVRMARRDANETFKKLLKDKEIAEDDQKKGMENIQELTDDYSKKIAEISEAKEQEVMQI